MSPAGDAAQELRRLAGIEDSAIDLAAGALALARCERPAVRLDRYTDHLAELAGAVAAAADPAAPAGEGADTLAARREALVATIHGRYGYEGDRQAYDDLQNADLMRVIDRRRGLPIALGILYIHCGRAQGWQIHGLNFPGHFLLRLDAGAQRLILDPFDGGRPVDVAGLRALVKATLGGEAELAPEHYAPATNREILIRLQNNRKVRLLKAERVDAALQTVETMLLFAPGEGALWHEAGVLNAHGGNLRAALVAFGHARDLAASPQARHRADRLIAELRSRLN